MTELEVCERARRWLAQNGGEPVRVRVTYGRMLHMGGLIGVSPVNAWIKVSGKGKIPAGLVTKLEHAE